MNYFIKIFLFFIFLIHQFHHLHKFDKKYELKYLDEYIIPEDFLVDSTKVGGLSDLDYDGKYFYTVVDLPKSPRIYKFELDIQNKKIDSLYFKETIEIPHTKGKAKKLRWDTEGLIYRKDKKQFIVSSEGSIKNNKDPFIATLDSTGKLVKTYEIPSYFQAKTERGLRHNGVFEGLTQSADGKGFWVSTELPMEVDGPTVKLFKTKSPVRFTYYDYDSLQPKKQFAYRLDRLRKIPLLPFGMNGVSAITEYKPNQFLVLERAFSAGHGRRGIRARIFKTDASKASNTLNRESLRGKIDRSVKTAQKKLLFDFNAIKNELTDNIIDNLEGITFGPTLANGNPTLVIISDNNYSSWTQQMNQIILLEIIEK